METKKLKNFIDFIKSLTLGEHCEVVHCLECEVSVMLLTLEGRGALRFMDYMGQ